MNHVQAYKYIVFVCYCILNPINTTTFRGEKGLANNSSMNFSLFQLLNKLRGRHQLVHFARALDLYNGEITVFIILW